MTQTLYAAMRNGRMIERVYNSAREAFDAACRDVEDDSAMPIDIRQSGRLVMSMLDVIELYDDWLDWQAGQGSHPLEVR